MVLIRAHCLTLSMKVHIMPGMNKLGLGTRVQVLNMLCEGSSIRAISRITGASTTTILKLLVDAGLACARFHDENVRGVKAAKVQGFDPPADPFAGRSTRS